MELKDFGEHVELFPGLKMLGVTEVDSVDPQVYVQGLNAAGTEAVYEVSVSGIREAEWKDLKDVLIGSRQPEVMSKMSRIVGYFSLIRNWNKSKLRELKDRHRGDYAVGEPQ